MLVLKKGDSDGVVEETFVAGASRHGIEGYNEIKVLTDVANVFDGADFDGAGLEAHFARANFSRKSLPSNNSELKISPF